MPQSLGAINRAPLTCIFSTPTVVPDIPQKPGTFNFGCFFFPTATPHPPYWVEISPTGVNFFLPRLCPCSFLKRLITPLSIAICLQKTFQNLPLPPLFRSGVKFWRSILLTVTGRSGGSAVEAVWCHSSPHFFVPSSVVVRSLHALRLGGRYP